MMKRFAIIFSVTAFSHLGLLSQAKNLTTLVDHTTHITDKNKPCIIMYSGAHCAPCRMMKPHFKDAAAIHPEIQFCIADVKHDCFKPYMKQNGISTIPTLIFSYNGKKVMESRGGLTSAGIEQEIRRFKKKIRQEKQRQNQISTKKVKKTANKPSIKP
jgi:thioredoxin-related protein